MARCKELFKLFCRAAPLAVLLGCLPALTSAQPVASPPINGTFPWATNNIGGSANGTDAAGFYTTCGLIQGAVFSFGADVSGTDMLGVYVDANY